MIKNKLILILVLAVSFIAFIQPCFAEARKLTIVFTGDARGELENCHCPKDDFGGLERRKNYINDVGKDTDEILLLEVGDVLPLFNSEFTRQTITYNAFISLKAMDMMGYDAMNAGESDLILGEKFLQEKSRNLEFQVISSNIAYKSTNELLFKPYVIKIMKNGLRVGIIGVMNERYIINSKNLEILPNKEMTSKCVEAIRPHVDVVIVLGHLGMPYSIDLANAVSGIDVILSGHWDSETQEPVKAGNTIIMPTGSHARKVGRLDLIIEDSGIVSSYEWQSTSLDERYEGDGFIKRLVSKMPSPANDGSRAPIIVAAAGDIVRASRPEEPLKVLVFYAVGCRACMEIERDLLPVIEKKYGEKIIIEKYDIGIAKNYSRMVRLEKLYGAEGGYVPEIIVSGHVLMGEAKIKAGLDKAIEKALSEPRTPEEARLTKEDVSAYEAPGSSAPLLIARFESFSAYAVGAAGLLDGINPCAFTTIVFFISFLAFAGYRKQEMFLAGSFFTIAVFIAYFLIGLGIFRFLRSLNAFGYLALAINVLIGGLAFLLGIMSVIDYVKFKKTNSAKASILQLPQSIKDRIHSVIGADFRQGKKSKRKALLKIAWLAFSAGFIVSILESICTGQVYLPTIAYVLRIPDRQASALSYLLVYNLAFITPLVIVFMLGLFGATSGAFSKFMQKHFGFVKLSTAVLFFVLGAVLVIFK